MKEEIYSKVMTYIFLLLMALFAVKWGVKIVFRNSSNRKILFRFWAFVRKPYYSENTVLSSMPPLRWLWQLFKVYFGFSALIVTISLTTTKLIEYLTSGNFNQDHSFDSIYEVLFFTVILAPFLEEGTFRLPLRLSAFSLASSIGIGGVLFIFLTMPSWLAEFNIILVALVVLCLLCIPTFYLLNLQPAVLDWLHPRFKKHFRWIYYFSSVAFGFAHLNNFSDLTLYHYLFIPILTLPQLYSGFFFGYARMRYGFWYGIGLHTLNNLSAAFVYIFTHITELL
ncbi:CPBP family glutamic-type intramembrane protease [Runella slithyformis]|uniref:CAAX prenyl protease 2/Lysostaphin resistance protein A-like domain-containing protein n=1 Tax=Runella slithyformis (strain ATCC 29530 / DSM 19594 / LMG 11500 / NCIMB 11436 / LSU 4) TaxID=761193 RepID=A0A7U3ZIN4_RUNSL|nr:CPBP family glutamic-type intramembrane protease [Runella slithyformis]AEI47925.1 hypothetical protein Runsl_1500 [Runella slithyformis DSM 19594]